MEPRRVVNRYTQPEPVIHTDGPLEHRRWSWWLALKAVSALVALVIVAVVITYGAILYNDFSQISSKPLDLSGLTRDMSGRTNVLLLGQGDPGHAGENLTDTMMLMSYQNNTKRIAQVSIPRDLRVSIGGYGDTKINAANAAGGVSMAEQVVSDTLGVPIHYYVSTDFNGLKRLVDAVGGVDVNVQQELIDTSYPCEDNQYAVCGLDIKPGLQHMDGTRALQYARCRKGNCGNDFGRAARQQEILNLVRAKAVTWQTMLNPTKVEPIARALSESVKTDMGPVQLLEFAMGWQGAQKNDPIRLVLSTTAGNYLTDLSGTSDLVPVTGDFTEIQDRVQNIFTEPTKPTDLPQN
jgi:LCP family protein required for cell wall assembly